MRHDTKTYVWQENNERRKKDRRKQVIDGMMIEDYDRRKEGEDSPPYDGPERRSGEDRRSGKDKKIILMVTDNPDDERLTLGAFQNNNIVNEVVVARGGTEALDYLFGTGIYADRDMSRMPKVILLDLNLHKIDGLEVLKRLRNDERTNLLPVVAFTSSEDDRNLTEYYRLRVNSFVRKPVDFSQFSEIISHMGQYWLVLNESPPQE